MKPDELEGIFREYRKVSKLDSMYSVLFHGFTIEFDLKPISILLLSIIATFRRANLTCWLSNENLAKMTGSTRTTVIKHLHLLEKKELIQRKEEKHERFGTNVWELGFRGEVKFIELQKLLTPRKKRGSQQ
jgi:DNA-binding MarR family transcriptional regulator